MTTAWSGSTVLLLVLVLDNILRENRFTATTAEMCRRSFLEFYGRAKQNQDSSVRQ
jgi:hypothetical protein